MLRNDVILFDYPGDRDGLERAVARFCSLAHIDLPAAPDPTPAAEPTADDTDT